MQGKSYETVKSVIDRARMAGVNFLDVFMSEPQVRTDIGRALAGKRQSVMIQGHIGACWVNAATILGYAPVIRDAFAPEKGEFLSLVTLGYPDARPLTPKRKSGRFDIR